MHRKDSEFIRGFAAKLNSGELANEEPPTSMIEVQDLLKSSNPSACESLSFLASGISIIWHSEFVLLDSVTHKQGT